MTRTGMPLRAPSGPGRVLSVRSEPERQATPFIQLKRSVANDRAMVPPWEKPTRNKGASRGMRFVSGSRVVSSRDNESIIVLATGPSADIWYHMNPIAIVFLGAWIETRRYSSGKIEDTESSMFWASDPQPCRSTMVALTGFVDSGLERISSGSARLPVAMMWLSESAVKSY